MTRLILTTSDSGAGALKMAGLADLVIGFRYRFTSGRLPSTEFLTNSLAARSTVHSSEGSHWLDFVRPRQLEKMGIKNLGLIEACARFETTELWIDPEADAQLQLVQLLDHFRSHGKSASGLMLRQASFVIGDKDAGELADFMPAAVEVTNDHLELAHVAWQAFRAPTPQVWFDLLQQHPILLPRLPKAMLALLEELPMRVTGLGATEMRVLELISEGYTNPFDLFPHNPSQRKVFDYWETGWLLDELARCRAPAVSGLDEGPFTVAMHKDRSRHARYKQSQLSLTALGEAVLAQTEDFSRHNPIHRWWGGTELTNARLWRWDPANRALIAP